MTTVYLVIYDSTDNMSDVLGVFDDLNHACEFAQSRATELGMSKAEGENFWFKMWDSITIDPFEVRKKP